MKKICNSKIESILTTKEIEGTRFSKWYMEKTEVEDGLEKKECFCGITTTDILEKHTGVKVPICHFECEMLYNKSGVIAAILKTDFEKVLKAELYITDVIKEVSSKNIDNSDYMFVIWNSGSHKVMSLDEKFISLPIHFNYIDGNVSNEYYNLGKVLDKVQKSPYVLNSGDIDITEIPYYNATERQDKQVSFYLLLPDDSYAKYQGFDTFERNREILRNELGFEDCEI